MDTGRKKIFIDIHRTKLPFWWLRTQVIPISCRWRRWLQVHKPQGMPKFRVWLLNMLTGGSSLPKDPDPGLGRSSWPETKRLDIFSGASLTWPTGNKQITHSGPNGQKTDIHRLNQTWSEHISNSEEEVLKGSWGWFAQETCFMVW